MGIFRKFFMFLDSVAFAFIDDAYNLILGFSSGTFVTIEQIEDIIRNMYVIVGIFALFKIALLLVNSLVNPDKLNEKGKGVSSIFVRTVIMLVMLIFSPFVFEQIFVLQEEIVGSNIIPKLIIGKENTDSDQNPGAQLKNIAISALISVNKNAIVKLDPITGEQLKDQKQNDGYVYFYDMVVDSNNEKKYKKDKNGDVIENPKFNNELSQHRLAGYIYNEETCGVSPNCSSAVYAYNTMYANNEMEISSLRKYINSQFSYQADDGTTETEYVYDYMILLTTATGIFITYILFSFALDLAVRVFELAVLQIISPLFIVTYIDPKSAASGPFSKWLKAFGNSFVGLFIRVAIICLVIFLVSWINEFDILGNTYFAEQSSLAKLILVWGLLAFAKKAPKWISDMLGVKMDGLGGLGIGKKLTNAALGGKLLAKGAKGLAGSAVTTGKNLNNVRKHNRQARKENLKNNPDLKDYKSRREDRKNRAKQYMDAAKANGDRSSGNLASRARKEARRQQREAMKEAGVSGNAARNAAQAAHAIISGAGAFSAAAKADKLTGALKIGNQKSDKYNDKYGLTNQPTFLGKAKKEIDKKISDITDVAYGNAFERQSRIDDIAKERNKKLWHKDPTSATIDSAKSFNESIKLSNGEMARNIEDAMVILGAQASGISLGDISYDKSGLLKIKIGEDKEGKPITVGRGSAEYEQYYQNQTSNLTSSGMAHYNEMFNKTQNSAFNEYQGNTQFIEQMASTIGSLNNAITSSFEAINSKFSSFAEKTGLTFNPSDGSLMVKLDDNNPIKLDPTNISESIGVLRDRGYDTSHIESNLLEFDGLFKERKEIENKVTTYSDQIEEATNNMEAYRSRNQLLSGMIQDARYIVDFDTGRLKRDKDGELITDYSATTLSGVQAKLSRETSKLKEKVQFVEAKDNEQEGKK